MIVRSTTGVEYEVVKPIGEGGVGRVFRAKRVRDGHDCALKVYDGIRHPDRTKIFFRIKKNIQKLMQDPICYSGTKQPCREFVGPLDADSLIELDTNKFGYIMELVDTKNEFITLTRFRTKADQRLFCRAARSVAELFRNVHFSGWCYKDINEKNIYINPQTAEVRIIDCDNISVQSVKVILGTPGFMAPEIYRTEAPDIQSDYFSTAVLFYRLFVGGWPLDGKRSQEYMLRNNIGVIDAAPVIYGTDALFAFDPKDRSNTIDGLVDPVQPNLYRTNVIMWTQLPDPIRRTFIKTFSEGLRENNRHLRAKDIDWIKAFTAGESETVACRKCGRFNFTEHKTDARDKSNAKIPCVYCGAALPKLPPLKQPPVRPEPREVDLRIMRDLDYPKQHALTLQRRNKLRGGAVHPQIPQLSKDGWIEILYHPGLGKLGAKNNTTLTWIISHPDDRREDCAPGSVIPLSKGMVITVVPRKLQMTVVDIR